jgi:hypothetical protein
MHGHDCPFRSFDKILRLKLGLQAIIDRELGLQAIIDKVCGTRIPSAISQSTHIQCVAVESQRWWPGVSLLITVLRMRGVAVVVDLCQK